MAEISHLRTHMLNGQWHIVLGFNGTSVQLWNNNGTRLLSHIKISPKSASYPPAYLCTAYCKAKDGTEVICVGDTMGNVHSFYQVKNVYFKESLYTISDMPIITALAGDPSTGILAVGTSEGKITLLSVAKPNEAEIVGNIPGFGLKFPVTSMAVLQCGATILLAAYSNGQIRGYALPDGKPVLTINAHSRAITAIDVHPSKSVIATVGEDSFFNLFEISMGASKQEYDVTLVLSSKLENTLLTGVAFLPPSHSSVIAVAYDEPKIFYWKDVI